MRSFRRLPPLLRVASLLGLLFPVASLTLLVSWLVTSLPSFSRSPPEPDFGPGLLALNLGLPLCALALALFIPPTPPALFLASLLDIAISLLGAMVLLAAFVWPPDGAS